MSSEHLDINRDVFRENDPLNRKSTTFRNRVDPEQAYEAYLALNPHEAVNLYFRRLAVRFYGLLLSIPSRIISNP